MSNDFYKYFINSCTTIIFMLVFVIGVYPVLELNLIIRLEEWIMEPALNNMKKKSNIFDSSLIL